MRSLGGFKIWPLYLILMAPSNRSRMFDEIIAIQVHVSFGSANDEGVNFIGLTKFKVSLFLTRGECQISQEAPLDPLNQFY